MDKSIREKLSIDGKSKFDDVDYQRVLGASAHINLIAQMIEDICVEGVERGESTNDTISNIIQLTEYFKSTRGKASKAISNAIDIMIKDINLQANLSDSQFSKEMRKKIEDYRQQNKDNIEKIVRYGTELLNYMDTIFLFDYSSTVAKMIKSSKKKLKIIIPESRILNGGMPYLKVGLEGNHEIHFIPDAAVLYYLRQCDGVFIGSETLLPDGTVFNTIGSELIASLCKMLDIPFYVLTSFLKIDARPLYGYKKMPVIVNLRGMYEKIIGDLDPERINFSCPELVEIPSDKISAFITEKGIVPPSAIMQLATDYLSNE